ncbi:hypothetical protein ACOZ4B_20885 (plasmid) [Haloferax prahovense]|uniref:hypothetical protein n=1 Tax=Haloferax prahovense TaxID=381852 RepID=UPI003C76CBEF
MGLYSQFRVRERIFGVFGLGVGFLFFSLSVLRTSYGMYAIFLYLLFRVVEGVAVVQFYRRVLDFLKTKSLSGNLSAKIRYHLLVLFIIAVGSYLVLQVITSELYIHAFWYDIQLIYTMVSFLLAFIGVRWRLRKVKTEYNIAVISGIGLCIAGAQTFDFAGTTDIVLSFAGAGAYSVGFWIAALFLLKEVVTPTTSKCTNCGENLDQ